MAYYPPGQLPNDLKARTNPLREVAQKGERDPLGKSNKEPGSKLDAGKAPVFRGLLDYFPRAVLEVAKLSLLGANKYSWKGWEKVPDGVNRYKDATGRHQVKEAIEGIWDRDEYWLKVDQKVLHQTQVAWNALAALELMLRDMEVVKPDLSRFACTPDQDCWRNMP